MPQVPNRNLRNAMHPQPIPHLLDALNKGAVRLGRVDGLGGQDQVVKTALALGTEQLAHPLPIARIEPSSRPGSSRRQARHVGQNVGDGQLLQYLAVVVLHAVVDRVKLWVGALEVLMCADKLEEISDGMMARRRAVLPVKCRRARELPCKGFVTQNPLSGFSTALHEQNQ
jgi:hypothetical protein